MQDSDKVSKVFVIHEDGRRYKGDILVGADGICGITDFVPPYIDTATVGYDCYQLILELDKAVERRSDENVSALRRLVGRGEIPGEIGNLHDLQGLSLRRILCYQLFNWAWNAQHCHQWKD
ncbi:hypothetical protein Dsin_020892 [Dipteronia sinensis]|uniref:FAD-binding domain-containing protein n=1 Tax=Dipteronia sinensis TaxID=43782 RepID=A0AAE0E4E3_9ROSI|nr:hypothetical protein Dsin_020892 [Dipteronia sinensis]